MRYWRWVAVAVAVVPTVAVWGTAHAWHGEYAGFGDSPIDVATVRLLNAWFAWQSVLTVAAPAVLAALGLLPPRMRGRAALLGAVLLGCCTLLAVVMAAIRGSLDIPAWTPVAPIVVAWLCVPCFAASAVALWMTRRAATVTS